MRSPVQIWLSAPRRTTSIPDVVFFALYAKRLLRNLCVGCGLRSTHSSASVWFVSLGRHLHGANLVSRFFALHAKRLLRNLCVGCPLRTPRERPTAFRRLRLLSSSPKSPDGYCYAIFALTVKLWLAVPYARLVKGLRLFVGFACCHLHQSRLMAIATQFLP